MFRPITVVFVFIAASACVDPACPLGFEETESGRCVVAIEPMDPMDPDGGDAAMEEPIIAGDDAAVAMPIWVDVILPEDTFRIAQGQSSAFAFEVIRAPGFTGEVDIELLGLPEGVTYSVLGASIRLDASPIAPVGPVRVVDVRATAVGSAMDDASFTLRVAGASGALDVSFDGDGMRTDTPFDGSHDAVVSVAAEDDGSIVVAGNGTSYDSPRGFVSWYREDGLPRAEMAAGGTRQIYVAGERSTQVRGLLPTSGGTLVSSETDRAYRMTRLNEGGDGDAMWSLVGDPMRESVWGGKLMAHGDGFLRVFSQQLERYHSDGSLDTAFGSGGVVSWSESHLSLAAAVLPDGGIVIGGITRLGLQFSRYDAVGRPSLAFGERGVAIHDPGGYAWVRAITALPDGGFIAVVAIIVNTTTLDTEAYLMRVGATGDAVLSFGSGGRVEHTGRFGDATVGLFGAIVDGDRILVWGKRDGPIGPPSGFVAAYTMRGELDASFGDAGVRDIGDLVYPVAGDLDHEAGRLVLGCDHPLSLARGAARMIAVARLWL